MKLVRGKKPAVIDINKILGKWVTFTSTTIGDYQEIEVDDDDTTSINKLKDLGFT